MTREIKFRAWDKKNKRWLRGKNDMCGWEIAATTGKVSGVPIGWDGSEDPDDFVVMQFTSLKDKNGKEIYEGDIVSNYDYIPDAHCSHNLGDTIIEWSQDGALWGGVRGEILEVIGNIYENPNLLKS